MSTAIQWTDETWNPSTGCTAISPGCDHCYAATMAKRLQAVAASNIRHGGDPALQRYTRGFTFEELSRPEVLLEPLRWKKPRRVFVCSMADLFHERATDEHIARVWAVMAACPQHTFQVLTKRPHRMAQFLRGFYNPDTTPAGKARRTKLVDWLNSVAVYREGFYGRGLATARRALGRPHWCGEINALPVEPFSPLPNVWLGTSVESQAVTKPGWHPALAKDGVPVPGRIDALLECPAAVRFLSCEPLLGPLDLSRWIAKSPNLKCENCNLEFSFSEADGDGDDDCPECGGQLDLFWPDTGLHWVICGGESGPGARPMHPAWARSLRDQCAAAGVDFFLKQFGAWLLDGEDEFRSFPDWVNRASRVVRGGQCFDKLGRHCPLGREFQRARDEGTFPVGVMRRSSGHNGDPAKWPAHLQDLNVRQYPEGKN